MSALSNLAKKNDKTIICTIHQPSSDVWKCLDKVLLLSLGRTIYMGPATDALGFFEEIGRPVPPFFNPPDHYLKVINTDFSENLEEGKAMVMEISEKYRESKYFDATKLAEADSRFLGSEDMSQSKYKHANSVLFQTVVLTERAYRNGSRNILLFWIRAAMFGKIHPHCLTESF
jgi:ABC-type multidrug transport system ATPase subunit